MFQRVEGMNLFLIQLFHLPWWRRFCTGMTKVKGGVDETKVFGLEQLSRHCSTFKK